MTATYAQPDHAAGYLVRAAVTAPSLHNTQPWLFLCRDRGITVHYDITRRLLLADPDGREMLLSCGAALFNARMAMRHLGYRPVVQLHPHPRRPDALAQVDWGAYATSTHEDELLYRAIRQRHTWRGPFHTPAVPRPLIAALREQARAEGAELYPLTTALEQGHLAELVKEAECLQRGDRERTVELAHWAHPSGDCRFDGVPDEACPFHPDSAAYAGRDFTGLTRDRATARPPWTWSARTGQVAVLTTPYDTPQDWLRAGQALQRVLLYATGHQVSAAFHTQPLELPRLRTQVRSLLVSRQFPQMILRLGSTHWSLRTARRPLCEVLLTEPPARTNRVRPTGPMLSPLRAGPSDPDDVPAAKGPSALH
ncbi:MAG TPA: hypothetical protein VFH94_28620 [Streptomyces sp.]|nr:hypothetical protein [Streptomyces sp.]